MFGYYHTGILRERVQRRDFGHAPNTEPESPMDSCQESSQKHRSWPATCGVADPQVRRTDDGRLHDQLFQYRAPQESLSCGDGSLVNWTRPVWTSVRYSY